MKKRRLWAAGVMLAALIVLSTGGERESRTAGGAAQVEVETEGPPLAAITFDDGPRPDTTGVLLEGLALREVPATFFLVGERLEGSEDLIRAMAAAGHQIGVHTYHHVKLTDLTREQYNGEVNMTREKLTEILGEGDYWLRPPYGIADERVQNWADGPLVLWSVDPEDWKDRDKDRIVKAVLRKVKDGDIILLHDIYKSSVEAALDIVDGLLERGFCLVTVEQLTNLRGGCPEPGKKVICRPPN